MCSLGGWSPRLPTRFLVPRPLPPCGLCVPPQVSRHHSGGVAPFGISGLFACMQLPLNVSPVSASFIGLERLGILLVLSVACSLLACFLASSSSHTPLLLLRVGCPRTSGDLAILARSWHICVCLLGWSRTPLGVRSLSSASLLLSAKLK